MGEFLTNPQTNKTIFYHGSRSGIYGEVSPDISRSKIDFGKGFYLGTNRNQVLQLISNFKTSAIYEFRIPQNVITAKNSVFLSKEEWMYYVLYNRGKLEEIAGTDFYNYFKNLDKGKLFVVGAIADDINNRCISDYIHGNITDYTFLQLIDCFNYGIQYVAKTPEACELLQHVGEHKLSVDERIELSDSNLLSRKEKDNIYDKKKTELNILRKGLYINEVFQAIRDNNYSVATLHETLLEPTKIRNIIFPNTIHEIGSDEIDIF